MADELNLETGDPAAADEEGTTRRRRRRRTEGDTPRRGPEDGLRGKLTEAFDKLAEQLDIRGDEELAVAIQEEAEPMAAGLDSLTRTVVLLRYPLVVLVALAMPILAFWRVGSILFRRWMVRRQRRWDEAQAAAEAEGGDDEHTPTFPGAVATS